MVGYADSLRIDCISTWDDDIGRWIAKASWLHVCVPRAGTWFPLAWRSLMKAGRTPCTEAPSNRPDHSRYINHAKIQNMPSSLLHSHFYWSTQISLDHCTATSYILARWQNPPTQAAILHSRLPEPQGRGRPTDQVHFLQGKTLWRSWEDTRKWQQRKKTTTKFGSQSETGDSGRKVCGSTMVALGWEQSEWASPRWKE